MILVLAERLLCPASKQFVTRAEKVAWRKFWSNPIFHEWDGVKSSSQASLRLAFLCFIIMAVG